MNKKEEGLILKMSNYRDNDGLATILLREEGLRNFVYRGYHKPRSKLLSKGIPVTHLVIDYRPKNEGLLNATQLDIKNFYRKTKIGVIPNMYAAVFGEIMMDLKPTKGESHLYFDLGLEYLAAIEAGQNCDFLLAVLISTICQYQGVAPIVDRDVNSDSTLINNFNIPQGGFVNDNLRTFNVMELKQLRLLFKMNFANIDKVSPIEVNFNVLKTMVKYLGFHCEMYLKSFELIESLR